MSTPKPPIVTVEEGTTATPTPPATANSAPSSFASRRRDREARGAAGETAPERRRLGFDAGYNVEPVPFEVTHVRA